MKRSVMIGFVVLFDVLEMHGTHEILLIFELVD